MSLDISKLTNIKRLPDGAVTSACPVCRESGGDSQGVHLWVHPSGAFKCVRHPDDRDHSRAIYCAVRGVSGSHETYEYFDYAPKLTVDKIFPEDSLSKLLPLHDYWLARGVKTEVLERLGGGVAAQDDKSKLSGRYVFSCRDSSARLVGFAGRLLNESSFAPKWKIIGKKSHFVWPHCLEPCDDTVILTEGIGDVLAAAGLGLWNTMALFGLNISSDQIGWLVAHGVRKLVISTNNEDSGIGNKAAMRLGAKLAFFFNEDDIKVHLPLAKDLLDSTPDQLEQWAATL